MESRQAQPSSGDLSADRASPLRSRAQGGHAHDRGADVAEISPAALAAANKPYGAPSDAPGERSKDGEGGEGDPPNTRPDEEAGDTTAGPGVGRKSNGQPLTKDEDKQVQDLKKQDRETRAHEQAHKSAAGAFAQGGPVFGYQQGPDGRRYAVSGSVNIDPSAIPGDPQATIQKMQVIQRAALAPSSPSGQDRRVAAQATRSEQKARVDQRQSRDDENASIKGQETQVDSALGGRGVLVDVMA